jgi:hypothetical protein
VVALFHPDDVAWLAKNTPISKPEKSRTAGA